MHDYFISYYSAAQLDELFEEANVKDLKGLIRKSVVFQYFYLLSLCTAKQVLSSRNHDLL